MSAAGNSNSDAGTATEACPLTRGKIVVRVVRSDSRDPVADAQIKLEGPTPGLQPTAGGTGTTTFKMLVPGKYKASIESVSSSETLKIPGPGYATATANSTSSIQLELIPPGGLNVQVVTKADNKSVADVKVTVSGRGTTLPVQTTPASGVVRFKDIEPGDYTVSIELTAEQTRTYNIPSVERKSVSAGKAETLIFQLLTADWIEIELIDEKGNPIPDEVFRIKLPSGDVIEGSLDSTGKARVSSRMSGECTVSFPRLKKNLIAPERKKDDWIEIVLKDSKGNPKSGEAYSIELPDGEIKEGSLDSTGKARVEDIPYGQCKVTFPNLPATTPVKRTMLQK